MMDRNGVGRAFDRYLELIEACDFVDRAQAELDKSLVVKNAVMSAYIKALAILSDEDQLAVYARIKERARSVAGSASPPGFEKSET